jgi:two-component sensor histidine kinase
VSDPPRPWYRPRLDGLAPRVAAFLTIALLPLGLIALWQTREVQNESERRAELSLLALTEQGAAGVQSAVERALGAAEALGVVADLLDDPATCSTTLSRFVESRDLYAYVGFLPTEGPIVCASADAPAGLWDDIDPVDLASGLPARVQSVDLPTGERMLVVSVPARPEAGQEGGFPGDLAIAIPRDDLIVPNDGPPELRPVRLVTFDASGRILTEQGGGPDPVALGVLLAPGRDLAAEAEGGPQLFDSQDSGGDDRVYTVTPLVPGVAYALGIWTPGQAAQGIGKPMESPLLFPLLMWIVSLVVAFWSLHGLMIRRVTELASRMRRFGRDRSLLARLSGPGAPYELREIEDAFRTMAASILQDEARMENAFRERGVLLREVHHRVKNNLQLISSIISMQVRRMPDPRTRSILRRLQDRVLTLASIYRSLYTSPDLGDVNAAPVVRAIVEQELRNAESAVEATLDIEDMVLDPDKVVPLAFLAAEAMSNAVTRARAAEGRPSVSVTLHRDGDTATLRIANSLDAAPSQDDPPQGLGQHLIQAFAAQVGGPVETHLRERLFTLSVTFPTATHHEATEDA